MPSPIVENEYPIELTPPDIAPYKAGNTGIDYITRFDSGQPGPHVMITAVVHGNELCGAIALDWLFKHDVKPLRGRLSLGFMNVDAFLSFDPATPTASRFVDEDFNRLWTAEVLGGPRQSVELTRARAVRPFINTVDILLDIHSMQRKQPAMMMAGPLAKGRELAKAVGLPEIVVTDAGHAAGKRMRDYEGFADPASAKNALLMECGQHWEAAAGPLAIHTALRFLLVTEMVDADWAAEGLAGVELPQQRFIEVTGPVTIESENFRFVENYTGLEVIPKAGSVIGYDGDKPVTTPYDDCVLIMPSRRLSPGASAVRLGRYVDVD
ncbi:M14 family metallopeptidase [Pelagibius marinus]|uniref:M14 family metallopeptidase n=1 Tax=Pelagibius marinus TaxID=2762760 RepID=UPI0018732FD9|nr:M14 family metallopeptidase [Pelagibius marinus]